MPADSALSASPPAARIGVFDRYLFLWIAASAIAGISVGKWAPGLAHDVNEWKLFGISLPMALLMWALMLPTMAKVRLDELSDAFRSPGPTLLTLFLNWAVAPALMTLLARVFLVDEQLRAGAILLGLGPCTGMVLFWISYANGNVAKGVVVTAINAITTVVLYAPLASLYLGVGAVSVSVWTVAKSVLLFVVGPLVVGQATRFAFFRSRTPEWFTEHVLKPASGASHVALIAMLVLLFSSEGRVMVEHPLLVAQVAVPLLLSTAALIGVGFFAARKLRYSFEDAVMIAFIGASTQFELAIATAVLAFGLGSGAALATVIGPLTEAPSMVAAAKLLQRFRPRSTANQRKGGV